MYPEEVPTASLRPGQVGYIACNMKEASEGRQVLFEYGLSAYTKPQAHIGDTLHLVGGPVDPMPGFQPTKAMVRQLVTLLCVISVEHKLGLRWYISCGQQ